MDGRHRAAIRRQSGEHCSDDPMSLESGGSVVENALDYQSKDRKIDPPILRSFD